MEKVRSLFRAHHVFLLYSSSSIILNIAMVASSIAVLRWVEPQLVGVWQMLLLVQSYAQLIRFGVASGLGRELPFFLGKGERERAMLTAETAQVYLVGCGAVGALCFLAAALWPGIAPAWRWGWLSAAVIWPANMYVSYLKSTFRANREFHKFSRAQLVEAAAHVFSVALVFWWGYAGMVLRGAGVALLSAAVLHAVRPLRAGFKFDRATFALLIRTGVPTHLHGYIYTLAMGFDRVILMQLGSVLLVGYYAPVMAVLTAMGLLAESVTSYLYPRITYRFGKEGDARQLWRPTTLATMAGMAMSLPTALIGWFVIPPAVTALFPSYEAAIPAMRIALLSGVLLGARPLTAPLITMKAWKHAYTYVVLFAAAKWIFPWTFSRTMEPLAGVALGGVVAATLMVLAGGGLTYAATRNAAPAAVAQQVGAAT